jgi:hypothetical protein
VPLAAADPSPDSVTVPASPRSTPSSVPIRPLQAGWRPNPRRVLWPFVLSLLVVGGTFTPPGELRDAATHGPVTGMRLVYSDAYIIGSPIFDIFDELSLLTVPQHYAVVISVLLAFLAWRGWRIARGQMGFRVLREAANLLLCLGLLVGTYAAALLVPRPMAKLQVNDPEQVVVDVHAHTLYSHDGRPGFTAEKVREWHAKAGFHAVYITDHKTYQGALDGMDKNPSRAGDGTVILRGLELRSGGEHVNVLSMSPADSVWIVDGDHLKGGMRLSHNGKAPVIVQTVPFKFERVAGPSHDTLSPTNAIEANDAAPRGLTQNLRDRERIVRLADSLGLALVAGSDNHGWGRTAAAWTLVPVPGWRALRPDQLADRIEDVLRREGRHASRVVERRTPELTIGPQLLITVPLMIYELNATLSPSQRLSWVCWIWGIFHFAPLTAAWWRGRRITREQAAA